MADISLLLTQYDKAPKIRRHSKLRRDKTPTQPRIPSGGNECQRFYFNNVAKIVRRCCAAGE